MKRIEERILWYEENSTNLYDDLVRIELKKVNDLYHSFEDCADELFVHEMMDAFCNIIEKQRERISELESERDFSVSGGLSSAEGTLLFQRKEGEFQNDRQLQEAFTQYCLGKGKSSYTVNDYLSRIKNLWKAYEAEWEKGILPSEMALCKEKAAEGNPLLNAYRHTEQLFHYIGMKTADDRGNRNRANTRAALNKLDEFRTVEEKQA